MAAGDGGCDKRILQVCYDKAGLDTGCMRTPVGQSAGAGGHDMGRPGNGLVLCLPSVRVVSKLHQQVPRCGRARPWCWLVLWPKQVHLKREETPQRQWARKSDSDRGGESEWKPVQMLIQVTEVGEDARRKLNGFWDSGA